MATTAMRTTAEWRKNTLFNSWKGDILIMFPIPNRFLCTCAWEITGALPIRLIFYLTYILSWRGKWQPHQRAFDNNIVERLIFAQSTSFRRRLFDLTLHYACAALIHCAKLAHTRTQTHIQCGRNSLAIGNKTRLLHFVVDNLVFSMTTNFFFSPLLHLFWRIKYSYNETRNVFHSIFYLN